VTRAARRVAALSLGMLALILSQQVMTAYVATYAVINFGWFVSVNAAVAVLVGWLFMGPQAGRGWGMAISNGLTSVLVFLLTALGLQAVNEFLRLAEKTQFSRLTLAIQAVFDRSLEWASLLLVGQIPWTIVIGGIVAGLLTELAARKVI